MRSGLLAAALGLGVAAGCDGEQPGWTVVHEDLPGALLSVTGTSANDVWAVGGDADDGDGPTVLRYDGSEWQRLMTGATGDLWWVYALTDGSAFMGGEDGLLLRHDGSSFDAMTPPGNGTVFGIWAAAPDDVWAVGGGEGGAAGAFAWRYDGQRWQVAPGFPGELASDHALWKVWGTAADDVWLVGTQGLVLHYDGQRFEQIDSGTTRSLFTVHALGERAAAVGGFGTGILLESDGGAWRDVTPEGAVQMIGVCLTADGGGYAVGLDGTVMRRDDDGWALERTALPVVDALHAVWVDPEGGVWAVGGQVLSFPLVEGVMIHRE